VHESRNGSENLIAHELFHKNDKKLMEEAELSMKGTSTSCTIIGAPIATIMKGIPNNHHYHQHS
jgi:hypothetical protein